MDSTDTERIYEKRWTPSSEDVLSSSLELIRNILSIFLENEPAEITTQHLETLAKFLENLTLFITSLHGCHLLDQTGDTRCVQLAEDCLGLLGRCHLQRDTCTVWQSEAMTRGNVSVRFSIFYWMYMYNFADFPAIFRPNYHLQRVVDVAGSVMVQPSLAFPSLLLCSQLCLQLSRDPAPMDSEISTKYAEALIDFMAHCPIETLRTASHQLLSLFLDVHGTTALDMTEEITKRCPYPSVQCALLYQYKQKIESKWSE